MQNLETLILLGFQKYESEENMFFFNGKHQTFIATPVLDNPHPYVRLYALSKNIDERPLSPRKGLPYINPIKDCCSTGSVERALRYYDTEKIKFVIGGAFVEK